MNNMNKKHIKIGESNGKTIFEEVEISKEEIEKQRVEEAIKQEERRKKYSLPFCGLVSLIVADTRKTLSLSENLSEFAGNASIA